MKADFIAHLPSWPYCAEDVHDGISRRSKQEAVKLPMIQPNAATSARWLVFDDDHDDAWFRPEERGLPAPQFIAVNRTNGHAHIGYELDAPVSLSSGSHEKPITFLLDVQRGICNRLGADRSYVGLVCKNPAHPQWETDWQARRPYDLHRLNDCLDKKDKRRAPKATVAGFGRNCTAFEELRKIAYKHVLSFKKDGKSQNAFVEFLTGAAVHINAGFAPPMHRQEVAGIAKSVARWTWGRFTVEKFSAIQSARVRKRWANHSPRIREAGKASLS